MLVYIIAIVLSVFLAYLYQRTSASNYRDESLVTRSISGGGVIFFWLSFLTLFVLSSIRVGVGTDYESYVRWFGVITSGGETYFEPLFTAMIGYIATFTDNPQWLFATSAFLTIGLIYVAVKKYSVNPTMSIFLFSSMSFLFMSFNGVRQFISVAIILLAYGYLVRRKWLKYIASIFVASLFHTTALIMIPVYFIVAMRHTFFHYGAIVAVAASSILFREDLLSWMVSIYPMYAEADTFLYGGFSLSEVFIVTGIIAIIMMLVFFNNGTMKMSDKRDRIVLNLTFYSLILHTLLAWIPAVNRLALPLDIAFLITIPLLLSKIDNTGRRNLLTAALVILYTVYISVSIGLNNSHDVLPYNTIFSGVVI